MEENLQEIVDQGIITPKTRPKELGNNLTYPPNPDGTLQRSLDSWDLTEVIIKENYKPPTLDKITQKLSKAIFFKIRC